MSSILKYICIEYNCNKCKYHNQFIDRISEPGLRPERCSDFEIKFIKNIDDYKVEYTISFKCKKCKKFGTISFDFNTKSDFNNDNEKDKTIFKTYKCCVAEVLINGILLCDKEEENIDKKNYENKKSKAKNENNQKLNDNKKANNNIRNNINF